VCLSAFLVAFRGRPGSLLQPEPSFHPSPHTPHPKLHTHTQTHTHRHTHTHTTPTAAATNPLAVSGA